MPPGGTQAPEGKQRSVWKQRLKLQAPTAFPKLAAAGSAFLLPGLLTWIGSGKELARKLPASGESQSLSEGPTVSHKCHPRGPYHVRLCELHRLNLAIWNSCARIWLLCKARPLRIAKFCSLPQYPSMEENAVCVHVGFYLLIKNNKIKSFCRKMGTINS